MVYKKDDGQEISLLRRFCIYTTVKTFHGTFGTVSRKNLS